METPTLLPHTMEQPRFGGVAGLPPLRDSGEGDPPQSRSEATQEKSVSRHEVPAMDGDLQRLLEVLEQLGISTQLERHQLKQERETDADWKNQAAHRVYVKNLLLKDRKGQTYLVLFDENQKADLHVLKFYFRCQGNLHLAGPRSLWALLRVRPGAVSPLALLNAPRSGVRVFIHSQLVDSFDQMATSLRFHPLRGDLEVGLTVQELKRFLQYCGVSLELLPSLTHYCVTRNFGSRQRQTTGWYSKHRLHANTGRSGGNMEETHEDEKEDQEGNVEKIISECADQLTQAGSSRDTAGDLNSDPFKIFQELEANITVEPTEDKTDTLLPCKCVYLKDKRSNYFLFVCHQNQKVDFSQLKMQLKPRKKIEPLEEGELQTLLGVQAGKEHPWALAAVTQPRFLVAIADNLYSSNHLVLTFPHPSHQHLHVKTSLKDLESFVASHNHDRVTIAVKGSLETLQAMDTHQDPPANHPSCPPCGSNPADFDLPPSLPDPDAVDDVPPHTECRGLVSPAPGRGNLFYQVTAPLRRWVISFIRWVTRVLDRYLPGVLPSALYRSTLWRGMLRDGDDQLSSDTDRDSKAEEHRRRAKTARLQQLLKESGIQGELSDTDADRAREDGEQCKTFLLHDGFQRPYFVLCAETDEPTQRNLRRLRTAFRVRSPLRLVDTAAAMMPFLSWQDGQVAMAWSPEDLHPLAALDVRAAGRMRVGMTGDLYCFPDTKLHFSLPTLGVTLTMTCEDLETMLRTRDFCVVYLP